MAKSNRETIDPAAKKELKSVIDRVERLMDDRKEINGDIKEIMDEAKATGWDTKMIRKVIAARTKDKLKREEEEAVFHLYLDAVDDSL